MHRHTGEKGKGFITRPLKAQRGPKAGNARRFSCYACRRVARGSGGARPGKDQREKPSNLSDSCA